MGRLDEALLHTTKRNVRGRSRQRRDVPTSWNSFGVGQSLSRLARLGNVLRVEQGIYVSAVKSRFGFAIGAPFCRRVCDTTWRDHRCVESQEVVPIEV